MIRMIRGHVNFLKVIAPFRGTESLPIAFVLELHQDAVDLVPRGGDRAGDSSKRKRQSMVVQDGRLRVSGELNVAPEADQGMHQGTVTKVPVLVAFRAGPRQNGKGGTRGRAVGHANGGHGECVSFFLLSNTTSTKEQTLLVWSTSAVSSLACLPVHPEGRDGEIQDE